MTLDHHPTAFPKLDDAQMGLLSKFATLETFPPRETLFATGQLDIPIFVLKSGQVEIVDRSSGQDRVIAVLEPGEFTGDVDMLTGRPAVVSGIARTAGEAYEIGAADLRRIVNELPRLGEVLLKAFLMRRQLLEESGFAAIRVVGSRYSRDTYRIRELLSRNKVPFTWIDLEKDSQVEAMLTRFGVSPNETPVVLCGSDKVLRNPSNAELAASLGIRKPLEDAIYDLAIVGAGPSGLAAAVYGPSEGLKTLILNRIGPGGQAGASPKIENYMGFPTGLSGTDLANRALIQVHKFGATLSAPVDVVRLDTENGYHVLHLDSGEDVPARCVLISAGAAYRKLDADGCDRFDAFGVYYAATTVEAEMCRGVQIVIVGSGNSAGQAAVYLSERASDSSHRPLGLMKEAAMSRIISSQVPLAEVAMRQPICVDRDTTIQSASDLMRRYQVGEVVVTDERKGTLVPVGIVSARDIVTRIIATRLDPTVLTAGDIAWAGSSGAKVTDSVSATLQLLRETRSTVLPVIDAGGGLAGVVSVDDLLWALAEE